MKATQPKKKVMLIANTGVSKIVNSDQIVQPLPAMQMGSPAQLYSDCNIDGKKMFICALCSYRTNRKSNITRHVDSNHNQNRASYKCSTCTKKFLERNNLKNHYITAHKLAEVAAKAAADVAEPEY